MTTPGGVPNLPQGALTIDTLASKTQDTTPAAMKSRAAERFSSIFNTSTGLDPASDITPFGILTTIFAGFNSVVANADPADVEGPEDLPGLLLEFIEGLPVVGQLVGLLEAILGEYDGEDETLLAIQAIFAPIRALVDALTGIIGGGDLGGLTSWFEDLLGLLGDPTGLGSGTPALPSISSIPILGGLLSGGNILAAIIPGLDASKITSGTFAQSMITNLTTMLGGFGSGSSILSQLIGAIPHGGSPTGITGFGNIFTDFFGLFGSLSGIGTGSPVPDTSGRPRIFGGILDGLFGGFTQIFDIPADQDAVADAAGGVNSAITGAQAGLSQLQAALSPGNPDSDDFERSNSGNWDTSQWLLYGDGAGGTPSVDGHNAVWESPYTVDSEMVGRRITKIATTDNQAVEVVLASAIGFITDGNAALDLWLRCTTFTSYATRTGLRFRFWGNKSWQLHWFNSGTATLLTSGTHSKSVSSGTFRFEAGQSLTTRRHVAKINSEPIMDFTEAGTTSQVGAAYRSRGVGLRGEFSLLGLAFLPAIEVQPCKLKQWSAAG